jgi:type II secretory pathway component PulF
MTDVLGSTTRATPDAPNPSSSAPGVTNSFTYRAARPDGSIEHGTVHANSREAAVTLVKSRGLLPVDVRVTTRIRDRRAKIRPAELALGLRILSDLLDAGLPMSRALAAFEELAPKSWSVGLPHIREAVREGRSLVAAFQTSGLEFPPLVLGVIHAGEAGGHLATAVRRAADFTETSAATRSAIRAALVYPAVLAVAGASAIGLLIGVVLPRFVEILSDLGQSMPASTRMVITIANAVRSGALPAVGVIITLVICWSIWTSTVNGRRRWHDWLLATPLIGLIRHRMGTAHATAALASLLESGVTLPIALNHAARATGDGALEARILASRERVLSGHRLGAAMAETRALTPTGIRLVRAGEDTGRLASMLHHAAKIEGEQAQQSVKGAVRLLEPVLILIFGAVVAFVAAALLQAIYSVGPTTTTISP